MKLVHSSYFAWTFCLSFFYLHTISASISRASLYPDQLEHSRVTLEPINGTKNFRMHGRKAKDDKWWDSREGRYAHCGRKSESKCEELEVTKQCFGQKIPYQSTSLDLTRYESQEQSLRKIITFQALKYVPKCWSVIQPFLCAVFFPKCENINGVDMVYLPTIEMCKAAEEHCKIFFDINYFPDFLKCNKTNFPSKCINDAMEMKFNGTGQCLKPLVPTEESKHFYKHFDGCGLQCKDPLFTDDEHSKVRKIIGWGASCCLIVQVFVIATVVLNWHHMKKYPSKALLYINGCYMMVCFGLLLQFLPGGKQDIVCNQDNTLRQHDDLEFFSIVVFILFYSFFMAGMFWFVIFAFSCHKQFQEKGSFHQRNENETSKFHIIAWIIPAVLTVACYAFETIEANSIVGICFVSNASHILRWIFLFAPMLICCLVSIYFLIRSYNSLLRNKKEAERYNARRSQGFSRWVFNLLLSIAGVLLCTAVTVACHTYELWNSDAWTESLKSSVICNTKSTYSDDSADDDSTPSCSQLNRPSGSSIEIQLYVLFIWFGLMSQFIFSVATIKTWERFFRRRFGLKVDEPLKVQKHKVIAQAYSKRKMLNNKGRLSISLGNFHTDPVGLNYDISFDSAVNDSNDFSSSWAKTLPHFVNRRCAITKDDMSEIKRNYFPDYDRRNSVDSEISVSICHMSVESRRNSNNSQVSVKYAECSIQNKVATRSRGSKSKSRSSRRPRRNYSKRNRKESTTSLESQVIAMSQNHLSTATTAEIGAGIMMPMGFSRRSGIHGSEPFNEFLHKNRALLPSLTTSDDGKVSVESLNIQDTRIDMLLKHVGITEDQENLNSPQLQICNERENVAPKRLNGSSKNLKFGHNPKLRKTRKTSKSIAKTVNSVSITNGSGKFKLNKTERRVTTADENFGNRIAEVKENLHGSISGRSDVGIQTEIPSEVVSSMEILKKQFTRGVQGDDDEFELTEDLKMLPMRNTSNLVTRQYGANNISESEKLKLLLLPSN